MQILKQFSEFKICHFSRPTGQPSMIWPTDNRPNLDILTSLSTGIV